MAHFDWSLRRKDWRTSGVIGRCRSVCRSVSRITHSRSNGRRSNLVAWAWGDPLEVINFWW